MDPALEFYTGTLGFAKKTDVPMGEHSWPTVVAADCDFPSGEYLRRR